MKAEVYSWRVSSDLKSCLEREARRRKTSVSGVLELAARAWLKQSAGDEDDEEEQRRLHRAMEKCAGSLTGLIPHSSTNVREVVRAKLKQRHGR